MHLSTSLATFFSLLVVAQCAPTKGPDSKTLARNGQQAQKLNVEFQSLKVTDPCNNGDKACLSGGVAICRNAKWDDSTGKCSKSQECFALPSNTGEGTLVTCTTESKALSAFQSAGVQGGIFGTQSGNSTATGQSKDETGASTTKPDGDTNDRRSSSSQVRPTKTVTVVVGTQPTTLPAVTRTLTPQEAYNELLKIMEGGATIVGQSLPTHTP